jgi:hypothetical protein
MPMTPILHFGLLGAVVAADTVVSATQGTQGIQDQQPTPQHTIAFQLLAVRLTQ